MITRLLLTATQYKYPLLRAPIIIISRQYSLFADESFKLKHKIFFKETLGVDVNKKVINKKHVIYLYVSKEQRSIHKMMSLLRNNY